MDLTIEFTCPKCQLSPRYPLRDLAPGQQRNCPSCRERLELTRQNLAQLERNLETYCGS